jgi:hypothetical protein
VGEAGEGCSAGVAEGRGAEVCEGLTTGADAGVVASAVGDGEFRVALGAGDGSVEEHPVMSSRTMPR